MVLAVDVIEVVDGILAKDIAHVAIVACGPGTNALHDARRVELGPEVHLQAHVCVREESGPSEAASRASGEWGGVVWACALL